MDYFSGTVVSNSNISKSKKDKRVRFFALKDNFTLYYKNYLYKENRP